MSLVLFGGNLYTPDFIEDGAVLIHGHKILAAGDRSQVLSNDEAKNAELIDIQGKIISPGLIDIQINGAGGADFTGNPFPSSLQTITRLLPEFGCTSFLPTLLSASNETILTALQATRWLRDNPESGAQTLGLHVEGPFLNLERAGAHNTNLIREPSMIDLNRWLQEAAGDLRLLTLAPEIPGASTLIREASQRGVRISLGHTAATYQEVMSAWDQGASIVTHLFNGMKAISAREPGIIGAIFDHDQFIATIIADGIHVHPALLRATIGIMGSERVVLVTDALSPVGTNIERFHLGTRVVEVRGGACYLEDGTLAGSILSMDQAIRNVVRWVDLPLADAFRLGTINPARAIGVESSKGSLTAGKDADVVIWTQSLEVELVFTRGLATYQRSGLSQ